MPTIKIEDFEGVSPRTHPRLLGKNQGQTADNCKLWSGSLKPWADTLFQLTPAKAGTKQSIHLFENAAQAPLWMHWLADVNVVKGPVPSDAVKRHYYTGDGVPKMVDINLIDALPGAEYPTDFLTLGVPAPTTVLGVTVINTTSTFTSIGSPNKIVITAATNGTPIRCTANAHGLVTGDVVGYLLHPPYPEGALVKPSPNYGTVTPVTVIDVNTFDLNDSDGQFSETGLTGWCFVQTELVITDTAHGRTTGEVVKLSGMPAPWTDFNGKRYRITKINANSFSLDGTGFIWVSRVAATGTWTLVYEDAESRTYVYTYVSARGEEGPPSPASTIVEVGPGEEITITGMLGQPAGDYDFSFKNIYRSLTAADGSTDFLYVGQVAITVGGYSDTLKPESLGEPLPSEGWFPPPTTLSGIIAMPNGILVGFSGNTIRFCVPFMPHAWPIAFELTTEDAVVALGAYGSSLVVTTEGNPYLVTGLHPAEMTMERLEISQSCVSKRGLVDTGYAVVYPSPDGMMMIGPGVAKLLTDQVMSRDDWQALVPSSISGWFQDGRYFGFYNDGVSQRGFILDPKNPKAGLTFTDTFCTAGYNDPLTDTLYLVESGNIVKWDTAPTTAWSGTAAKVLWDYVVPSIANTYRYRCAIAGTTSGSEPVWPTIVGNTVVDGTVTWVCENINQTLDWKSKVYATPRPVNMNVAQVLATDFDSPITLKLYGDGILRHTRKVYNNKPFRLPGGYMAEEWEVEVLGTREIKQVIVSDTMQSLSIL